MCSNQEQIKDDDVHLLHSWDLKFYVINLLFQKERLNQGKSQEPGT